MEKKVKVLMGIVVGLLIVGIVGFCVLENRTKRVNFDEIESSAISMTGRLVGLAESQEEAESIAELYGIQLESYEYGVATFTTGEELQVVIERGKTNGYPELSIDNINYPMEEKEDSVQ